MRSLLSETHIATLQSRAFVLTQGKKCTTPGGRGWPLLAHSLILLSWATATRTETLFPRGVVKNERKTNKKREEKPLDTFDEIIEFS